MTEKISNTTDQYRVQYEGKAIVKVSIENGAITAGDLLTTSATNPGTVVKATETSTVTLGLALESIAVDGEMAIMLRTSYVTAAGNSVLSETPGDVKVAGTGKLYFGDAETYYFSLNGTTLELNTAFKASGDFETSGSFSLGGGITWSKGAGAPTGTCTTGSMYSRVDGSAGSTLYVCEKGAWIAK